MLSHIYINILVLNFILYDGHAGRLGKVRLFPQTSSLGLLYSLRATIYLKERQSVYVSISRWRDPN